MVDKTPSADHKDEKPTAMPGKVHAPRPQRLSKGARTHVRRVKQAARKASMPGS